MFTHLLVATDGSACALQAANVAAMLAAKFQARLTIVNVFQPSLTVGPYGEIVSTGLNESDIQELQRNAILQAGRAAEEFGIPYESRHEVGQPATEIVRVAEEEGCDLIVLGSRGLNAVASLFLGSVSDRVTHHAHCPILIVR